VGRQERHPVVRCQTTRHRTFRVCLCVPTRRVVFFPHWTDGLLEAAAAEVKRRRGVYGDLVFWLGDFNIRVGPMRGRASPDTHAPNTQRARRLRYLMRTLSMLPVHGRAAHIPAGFTSKHVAGRPGNSEVDYIMAPAAIPATAFRLIQSPTWGSGELQSSGTHLPLFIEASLPSSPVTAPARRSIRQRKPFSLPPYCDRKWFDIHARIAAELPQTLQLISSAGTTLDQCSAALTGLFRSAAIAECGTAMARAKTFKRRLYKGAPLPSELVNLFNLARYQRRKWKCARGARARQFWKNECKETKRTATTMADSFLLRFRDSLLLNLQHEMRIDPHQVHGYLAHLRGAESTNCAQPSVIPPGPDGRPPLLRFGPACRRLVTQTGAVPAAVTSDAWLGQVFQAAGGDILMRHFSAHEIYPYVFPPTKRHRFEPCHRQCRICRQYAAEIDQWRPNRPFPTMPVPHHRGGLHTSRGASLDGLVAELLRWVRPEDFRDRYDYRMAVCDLLARFFNRMLDARAVPSSASGFASCVTSPLYKAVKPGSQPPPRWDDDAYRFITNSSLLAKAFSTVLASRLSHWAIRTGLLSEQQVAFLPFRGTEEHVFTLQQVTRERARRRLLTYLLFVDFKKAYDSVHLEALWVVLRRQGVPSAFVDLLRDWSSKRTTQVRVNGELSEPFPMSKGVPQGDPLSCLLFNLFIDSLSRYLQSRPDLPGVTAFHGGISLQHQLYADDLLGLAGSAAELQRMLTYVKRWADAWGMELNTGPGKTEAMLLDADAPVAPPQLAPLRLNDGREVRWTVTYRYLGYSVRCDLSDVDAFEGMLSHLRYLWNSHFFQNGIVRHASAAFQMQYYCTMVQGSLRNLRALTSIYARDAERLEVTLRQHISSIFGGGGRSTNSLTSALGAMLPWHAIHAQEHERLYLQLSHPLFPDSVAARVFRLAQADPQIGQSLAKRNWVRAWEQMRASFAAQGVPLAAPGLRRELIPAAAKSFGRAVAFVQWQQDGRSASPGLPACDASTPPSYRPLEAAANLFENFRAPLSSLGTYPEFTPLSATGPGCSGSMISRTNLPASRLAPIVWARSGAAAMSSPLFFIGDDDQVRDYAAHARPCGLCGSSPIDPYHLVVECNHVLIDSWREAAELAARDLVTALTVLMARERSRAGREPMDLLFRRIRRAAATLDFDSPEGDFILFRLVVGQPWSERMACPGMRLTRLLGRAFDLPGIYHRFERPAFDAWSRWSLRWLWGLSRAWREAHR